MADLSRDRRATEDWSAKQYLKFEEPPKRHAGVKVGSIDELVSKLKQEAQVL